MLPDNVQHDAVIERLDVEEACERLIDARPEAPRVDDDEPRGSYFVSYGQVGVSERRAQSSRLLRMNMNEAKNKEKTSQCKCWRGGAQRTRSDE
jgi:hypothetical protein